MFRKLISISLIYCILASLLSFAIPLSWYVSNYTHIATHLCVNRDNPNIDCNGVCQLRKRLNQNDDHEHSDTKNGTIHDRSHRLDLFLTNQFGILVNPTLWSNTLSSANQIAVPIWINEPLSPPPKLG